MTCCAHAHKRDACDRSDKTIIEGWLGGFPSRDAAVAALEAERVPCAPVLTLHEVMAHPHLRQRGTVRRVRDATR